MFTLQQIKAAHSKVKTGADFPGYIQEIKALGLITYEFMVTDGSVAYYGENGHRVAAGAIYESLKINGKPSADELRHSIAIHQQRKTDFITFCKQVANAGVDKWIIDTRKMLCTYQDYAGDDLVVEPIPDKGYEG